MSIYIDKLFNNQGICCTEKCLKVLSGSEFYDAELTGRERQFCMLLKSEDKMSRHIGLKMIDKVDLEYLFQAGYIQLPQYPINAEHHDISSSQHANSLIRNQDFTEQNEENRKTEGQYKDLKNSVELSTIHDDIDPVLKLISGNI